MTTDVSEFMWKEYEQQHVDFPEPTMERMFESKFKRNYTVYMLAHFTSRIVTLDSKFELPDNSILHVADNFFHMDDCIDTPRLDDNIFVQNETYMKYLYHIRDFNKEGPVTYEDKYIYRQAGLPSKLLKYRSEHGSEYKYLNSLEMLPPRKTALTIINHNPLFRIRVFGRLKTYRRVQQILASILNTIVELAPTGKNQFIVLPWGEEYYDKALFLRNRDKLTFTTIKKPENLHYILMMHLVNYFWDTATTSIFSKVPDEVYEKVYFVFNTGDKYVFYNFKALKAMDSNNRVYRKLFNQTNLLSVLGRPNSDTPESKQLVEELTADEAVNVTNKPTENVIDETRPVDKVYEPKIVVTTSSNTVTDLVDSTTEDIVNKLNDVIAPKPVIPTNTGIAKTNVSIDIPQVSAPISDTASKETKISSVTKAINTTKLKDISSSEEHISKEYVTDLEKEADTFIDNNELLTPAAKNRFKKVARKYQTLELDGVPLKKILENDSDLTLKDTKLDPKIVGDIPDPSALDCSLHTYDKDYINKTYKKHIAGIITSFQKSGVYLVDLKEEKVVTDLHNYTVYSCQYEDIEGKKSTVKFKLPNINEQCIVKVDGVKQYVKKQRFPLPIIKISDTVVTLTSNYNKSRVVRNTNKAHNYLNYVHSFLTDHEKSNCRIYYGKTIINLPLAYEYTELARRYDKLEFTSRTDLARYTLFFNYNNRNNEFDGKPDLLPKLEAQYGTYFGKTNKLWLFVDNTNKVSAVKKTGGETDIGCDTVLDVCKLALNVPAFNKIKPLSEWVTITILDLNIPIIFMLAYRYGLRNTLDYIGAKYTITENRSKTIVGENEVEAGIEGFNDVVAGDIPEYDDSIEDYSKDTVVCHEGIWKNTPNILGLEALGKPVKPRLDKVKLYLTLRSNNVQFNNCQVQVRAMLITVALGTKASCTRRVTNYDSAVFTTPGKDTVPRDLVDKASAYLNCGLRKISKAEVVWIPADKVPDRQVLETPRLTPVEYKKMTSKLNINENKVRPPQEGSEDWSIGFEDISEDVKYVPKPNDIHIKFADRVLHINRYPLAHSLIVAGLEYFDVSRYDMSEFESKDVYYRLLMDKKLSINYIKGMDSFYDLFVDNMTYSVLKMMHEPTTVRDLLIRSTVLLTTTDHLPASSGYNHRIRGYEQFAGVVYNELAREFAAYQSKNGANNKFSVNPDAVYLRIIQNASMLPAESGSPLEDMTLMCDMTYGGVGGRSADSFVITDRHYDASDIGVVSESTVDNQKVAFNSALSYNPNIVNTLGMPAEIKQEDLKASQVFSPHALMFPFSTSDDSKRMNFVKIQCAHLVPTEGYDKARVRTGYERVLAHRCGKNFAGVAKDNGKITAIDEKARLVEVTYTNGTKEVYPYGSELLEFDSMELESKIVCNVKLGQKVNKGDIITYNTEYFKKDTFSGQVDMTIGTLANVIFMEMDTTLEDSFEMSQRLSRKLTMNPVNVKVVSLSGKSLIHKYLDVGTTVSPTDDLMIFEEDPTATENINTNDEALEMLAELNRRTPSAGHAGKIIRIDAYYSCDPSEMHPTVYELVKKCTDEKNRRYKLAKSSNEADEYPQSSMIKEGSKYKGVTFDKETVVFIFHIQERIPHSVGDKLVVCNQLKATCGGIFPKPVYSESGIEVDMLFSMMSTNKRIVLSPFKFGITSRILMKIEDDICMEYFGEHKGEHSDM